MSIHESLLHIKLDASAAEPLWRQLYNELNQLLANGELQQGFTLPSERDLSQHFSISRSTVKRCYDELRFQKMIGGKGKVGSVVRSPEKVNPVMGKLKGFTQEMTELGKVPSSTVVQCVVAQDRAIASVFGRPSHAEFLHLIRIRYADEVPMTREVAWYDLTLAPELKEWNAQGSIYDFIQSKCSLALDKAEQSIEAVHSNKEESEAFGFVTPTPCLLLKRWTKATSGQLVEYVEGTFRGDAYVYRLQLA